MAVTLDISPLLTAKLLLIKILRCFPLLIAKSLLPLLTIKSLPIKQDIEEIYIKKPFINNKIIINKTNTYLLLSAFALY